jgi:hypothetical protein
VTEASAAARWLGRGAEEGLDRRRGARRRLPRRRRRRRRPATSDGCVCGPGSGCGASGWFGGFPSLLFESHTWARYTCGPVHTWAGEYVLIL